MRQIKKISAKKDKKIEDLLGILDLGKVEQVKQSLGLFQSVNDVLRKYKSFPRVIWADEIDRYFDKCYKNGIVTIDTETDNSVDPRTAIMVGMCLFTPYSRPVYIPVNHLDKLTLQKLPNQVSLEKLSEKVEKFKELFCIYHNAKFDVNVIETNLGVRLPISWDTMIGAKVLNENDLSAGLKSVYVKYIEPAQPTYNISNLFAENKTADVQDFALYSAMDSYDTYKVYLMQKKVLESPTMQKLYHLLVDLEFKITEIAAEMEQEGAHFDKDLAQIYLKKYEKLATEKQNELNKFFEPLRFKSDFKLQEWPVNVSSADQVVSALNAMGIQCEDSQEPTLKALSKIYPICNTILECRSANHMVTSFFRPYIEMINCKTGRLHANFNQMGSEDKTVKTGRFSCIAEGTHIQTPTGAVLIEHLKKDDLVYSYSADANKIISKSISAVIHQGEKECFKLYFKSAYRDHILICTADHQILTFENEWVQAKDLEIGEFVKGSKYNSTQIECYKLTKYEKLGRRQTYDLTIDETHNFIASNIIVHNCQNPNLQQLPSFDDSVRLCFNGATEIEEKEFENELELYENDEVETTNGYKYVKDLQVGDKLVDPEDTASLYKIISIESFYDKKKIRLS